MLRGADEGEEEITIKLPPPWLMSKYGSHLVEGWAEDQATLALLSNLKPVRLFWANALPLFTNDFIRRRIKTTRRRKLKPGKMLSAFTSKVRVHYTFLLHVIFINFEELSFENIPN